jgi:hypothetical protein
LAVFIIDFTGAVAISVANFPHFSTFGATTSAHRTIALAPAFVSCHAHFTICGANNRAGSCVTIFCVHSNILEVAHRVPPCSYACPTLSAPCQIDFTIPLPSIDAVSPTHSLYAVLAMFTVHAPRL